MTATPRGRLVAFVVPMILGLIAVQRAASHVRTVDILLLFAGGMAFGAGLVSLLHAWRARGAPKARQVGGYRAH